jgi:1-acyl-sn-glycerol-3-phosphate acyltransferase
MSGYRPTLTERLTNIVIRGLTTLLCRVDADQLARVPARGPLIAVTNHVNFLEVPVIYPRVHPRSVTGFAKIESWDSAFLGWLFDVWGVIPIRRGKPDRNALKKGLQALEDGYILTIAPEGTRSRDGCLLRGQPGVVMVALLSNAPMVPVVHYGHENYMQCYRNLRRPDFHVRVGRSFKLRKPDYKVTAEVRQTMTDEIMCQLAAILPETYRGVYADKSKWTDRYLEFIPTTSKRESTYQH